MSDQTKAAERAARELADLAEVVDERPLMRRERLRHDEIAAWVRGVVGAELKSYDEIDAWAREAIRAELKDVELLAALQAYLVAIGEQENMHRRRTETDRAYDSEIEAAAGLGREHDEADPLEALPDDRPASVRVERFFERSAAVDYAFEAGADVVTAVQALRQARAHGFDLTTPGKCGPLFAVMAEWSTLAARNTADRLEPLPGIDPQAWGDAFSASKKERQAKAYQEYCKMHLYFGVKPSGQRQYQRDLSHGKNTIANFRRTGKTPRRGRKR